MSKPALKTVNRLRAIAAIAAVGAIAFAAPAYADCTSPAGPEGSLNYVDSANGFKWCDGTNWQAVGGGGSASALNDLSDVYTDYATDNNIIVGDGAGVSVAAGAQNNTIFGQNAFAGVTTADADRNTAFGYQTLANITSGSQNTAIGLSALINLTSGWQNTAVGDAALQNNQTGSYKHHR